MIVSRHNWPGPVAPWEIAVRRLDAMRSIVKLKPSTDTIDRVTGLHTLAAFTLVELYGIRDALRRKDRDWRRKELVASK